MPDEWMDVNAELAEVPVNIMPLIDDTDFKSIEDSIAYNAAGMALKWNFRDAEGGFTQTAVTPTTSGTHDWAHQGGGMYTIEIPASGGASIDNDTEGFGQFTGVCDGVLPWRGPIIGFRADGLNSLLIKSAYSLTRGLAGTALPDVAGGVALASVVGALNDAAAAGEVTTSDTVIQYLKQLINILIGTPGIGAFPAEAAPANDVSLAEVIRAIHADVTGLNGSVIVGANANKYLGDYKENGVVYFLWSISGLTGGTVKVYKNDSADEVTPPTGITDDRDHDSKTGIHKCKINLDASANSFYVGEKDYSVVLSGGTQNGQTVSMVIANFSIENRNQGIVYERSG